MNEVSKQPRGGGGGGGELGNNKRGLQLKYKRPLPSSSGFGKIQGDGRKFLDRFKLSWSQIASQSSAPVLRHFRPPRPKPRC